MSRSELKNGVYHTTNARMHASYMLWSTTRKGTLCLCVILYLSPNMQSTGAN